ncbi:hypothetical protein [Curtobacterium sp. PhB78]|uniref:hypothetical protein n=1 Tax=Curtobacterium sp. PhB78 TaxID=2485102 RepID=UPI000F48EA03|nr:hypothetical protein [Curtobacterium sp. PhB78]ROS33751.1 hypothetical protein EDF53_3250 [Curtobacterium sp. PhB78]
MKHLVKARFGAATSIPWLLFLAADGFLLFTDRRWVGELTWAVEWANGGLYLSSSLLAALVVFSSRHLLGGGSLVVLGATGWAGRIRHLGAIWTKSVLFGVSAHAVVCAVALTWTLVEGTTDRLAWQPFVYALLPIAYAATLGLLIAVFVPSIVGAALALVLAYVLAYMAATGALQIPVVVGGITGSMVGIDYSNVVLMQYVASTALIVGLGICGALIIMGVRSSAGQPWTFAAALVLAVIIPSVLLPVFPDRGGASDRTAKYECAGEMPQVCVLPGHTTRLTELSHKVRDSARPLVRVGVNVDGMVLKEERLGAHAPTSGRTLMLDTSRLNQADFSPEEIASALAQPGDCYASAESANRVRLEQLSYELTTWIARGGSGRSGAWARNAFESLDSCSP